MDTLNALWHSIWSDNSTPGRIIVLVIIALLLWALRSGSRHSRRYLKEERNLSIFEEKLREAATPKAAEPGNEELPNGPQPVSPADLAKLREGLAPDSLIAERIEAIEKLRTRQVRVNPSALQQLSLARDEARPGMAVPGAVAGLATMLGLLGTFIGLAMMVQQIQFVLPRNSGATSIDSWTQSVDNISRVLGGIKTAFSASLVGIACSILASLINFRMRTAQALLFERLERFTTVDLLPAAVPAVEDESLLDRVSLQLENSFSRLEEIYRQNQESIKDMTGAQRAFVDIVEEIRKITRSEASQNLEGVLEQLAQTNRSVLAVTQQLPKIVSAVESGQHRLLDRLSTLLSSFAPMANGSSLGAKQRLSTTGILAIILVGLLMVFFYLKTGA